MKSLVFQKSSSKEDRQANKLREIDSKHYQSNWLLEEIEERRKPSFEKSSRLKQPNIQVHLASIISSS